MNKLDDVLLGILMVTVVGALVLFAVGGAMELAGAYRSFDAKAACLAQRMQPVRKPLSAKVVCAPPIQRQDTTTVNITGQR